MSALKCPRCTAELAREDYESIPVDRCPECAGVWLDRQELRVIAGRPKGDAKHAEVCGKPVAVDPQIDCLLCGKRMERFKFRQTEIVLDRCVGHGTWLDEGELERVREAAEKLTQPPPPPGKEKQRSQEGPKTKTQEKAKTLKASSSKPAESEGWGWTIAKGLGLVLLGIFEIAIDS